MSKSKGRVSMGLGSCKVNVGEDGDTKGDDNNAEGTNCCGCIGIPCSLAMDASCFGSCSVSYNICSNATDLSVSKDEFDGSSKFCGA